MAKKKTKKKYTMPEKHKEKAEQKNMGTITYICAEMTGNGKEIYKVE